MDLEYLKGHIWLPLVDISMATRRAGDIITPTEFQVTHSKDMFVWNLLGYFSTINNVWDIVNVFILFYILGEMLCSIPFKYSKIYVEF